MQTVKTVMERNRETFESKVNELLESGYGIISGDCKNFNPSGQADPCWVAILVKGAYQAMAPQITLNVEDVKGRIDADYVISEISKAHREVASNHSGAACV